VYRYLYARTLAGRSTREAIRHLDEILVENPDFAPAHRTLAEIYASEAFHDAERADAERQKFQSLCPGATVARRPGPLPDPSPLVDEAERLLGENGDPDRAAEMAMNGIRADEWRLQRIRPFDWYSAEFKRQSQRELQAKYWKAWSIQVRCYRKAGRHDKAAELLAQMEERAQSATGSENRAAAAAEIRRLRELITRREPD
jgi:pentatricopeptide repeat protein